MRFRCDNGREAGQRAGCVKHQCRSPSRKTLRMRKALFESCAAKAQDAKSASGRLVACKKTAICLHRGEEDCVVSAIQTAPDPHQYQYRPRSTRGSFEPMTTARMPPQLGHIDDEELERLATSWRGQALRGDREAYGIAHALEVEQRRRLRESQLAQLPPEPVIPARPWWKFWQGGPATGGPMSPL